MFLVFYAQLPYMLDVHLFMGWQPRSVVPEGERYDESQVYYGNIPLSSIDPFSEFVRDLIANSVDLVR